MIRALKISLVVVLRTTEVLHLLFSVFIAIVFLFQNIKVQGVMADDYQVYIRATNTHTDIFLDRSALKPHLGVLIEDIPPGVIVGIVWGERNFYEKTPNWSDLTFQTAVNALFYPSQSAMHLMGSTYPPKEAIPCKVSAESLVAFIEFFKQSFVIENDHWVKLPFSYGQHDAFFASPKKYHLFNTCNSWTNEALKKLQISTSLWTPFPRGVIQYIPKDQ